MFNNVYRLTGVRQIEQVTTTVDSADPESVIVRPTLMSICRADERYYTGTRDKKVLAERLPMALIHEAVGVVVRDNTGTYAPGTHVAMVPTNPHGFDELVSDNYLKTSTFSSSTTDGFMREYVFIKLFHKLVAVKLHFFHILTADRLDHADSHHTCLLCGFKRSGYVVKHNAIFWWYAERFCGVEVDVRELFAFAENGGRAYSFKHSPQSCVFEYRGIKLGSLGGTYRGLIAAFNCQFNRFAGVGL